MANGIGEMLSAEESASNKKQRFLDSLFDLDLTPEQRVVARELVPPGGSLALLYHSGNSGFHPKILTEQERNDFKAEREANPYTNPKILQEIPYDQI